MDNMEEKSGTDALTLEYLLKILRTHALCNSKTVEDAEDAVQEVLHDAVWELTDDSIHRFVSKGKIRPKQNALFFLKTCVLHVLYKQYNRLRHSVNCGDEIDLVYEFQSVEHSCETTELDLAIQRLDATDQKIIRLRYWKSMSYKQIGESCDMSEECASRRCSRARDELKKLLSDIIELPNE